MKLPDELNEIVAKTLAKMGEVEPVESIDICGLNDDPGFHWSNPGLKLVKASSKHAEFAFVMKKLSEQSKREVRIYQFLSEYPDFPIPKLYHWEYDDLRKFYCITMERCVCKNCPTAELFWEEIGILFAEIHHEFWNKTEALPELFHQNVPILKLGSAIRSFESFVASLSDANLKLIDTDLKISIKSLCQLLKGVETDIVAEEMKSTKCLLHGAFHPPEILWRCTDGHYVPIGVDWERSRVGAAVEDFTAIFGPLSEGNHAAVAALFRTYFAGMNRFGIEIPEELFIQGARSLALAHHLAEVLPFVLGQYIEVCSDSSFLNWCSWVRASGPVWFEYVRSEISTRRPR